MTKLDVNPVLSAMVDKIVEDHHPLKVILFGSRSRGDAGPDSDYDLLVIADIPGSSREYRRAIYHSLYELKLPVGKDIVVATPEEIKRYGSLDGWVYKPALREGTVVYERAA